MSTHLNIRYRNLSPKAIIRIIVLIMVQGPLVGGLKSTRELAVEYAAADPIYVQKTSVCSLCFYIGAKLTGCAGTISDIHSLSENSRRWKLCLERYVHLMDPRRRFV